MTSSCLGHYITDFEFEEDQHLMVETREVEGELEDEQMELKQPEQNKWNRSNFSRVIRLKLCNPGISVRSMCDPTSVYGNSNAILSLRSLICYLYYCPLLSGLKIYYVYHFELCFEEESRQSYCSQ